MLKTFQMPLVSIRNITSETPIYSHASNFLFIDTFICYCYFCRIFAENVYRTLDICEIESVHLTSLKKEIADI